MKIYIPGKSTVTVHPSSGRSISIPGDGPISIFIGGGPSGNGLLMETGDYLLLETGDYILMEA